MNTAAPSLVHLPSPNFFSGVRKHSYGLHRKNPLQDKRPARSSRRFMNSPGWIKSRLLQVTPRESARVFV